MGGGSLNEEGQAEDAGWVPLIHATLYLHCPMDQGGEVAYQEGMMQLVRLWERRCRIKPATTVTVMGGSRHRL